MKDMFKNQLFYYIKALQLFQEILNIIYFFFKFYRVLIQIQMVSEMLPLYNPYKWPLNMIRIITRPYLNFLKKFFPTLKIYIFKIDITYIIAFEIISIVTAILQFSREIIDLELAQVIITSI